MKGCRPLTRDEVRRILDALQGSRLALRNRCLVQVGIYTGFRISELLSLRVGDVLRDGKVLARVRVERKHMKGKRSSRDVPLNKHARDALAEWLPVLFAWRDCGPDLYLFQSSRGGRLSRRQAGRILSRLAGTLRLGPGIGTHSLRKTFAQAVYDRALAEWRPGHELPVRVAMKALGHSSVEVTEHYLGLDVQAVDAAVLALQFGEAV